MYTQHVNDAAKRILPLLPTGATIDDAQRIVDELYPAFLAGIADDLGGVAECSRDIDVSPQSLSNFAARRAENGFPEPIVKLRATTLWSRSAVRQWRETTQRSK